MFLDISSNPASILKTSNYINNRVGNCDARKRMLRLCEACNGCSFNFLASLVKNVPVKTVFASYYWKLSLLMFLKCFLIFAYFQLHVSYRCISYKNTHDCNRKAKLVIFY